MNLIKETLKKDPRLFNLIKKIRNYQKFNKKYFNKLIQNNFDLINDVTQTSYINYAKQNYFQIKENDTKKQHSHIAYVEINNSCNINCVMCDTKSSTRKKALMKLDLVEESVIQLKRRGITTVGLHTIGDPLANTRLKEVFEILRKHKMFTSLSTNGLLLHKHIDTLENFTDVCRVLRFSIDGATKITLEKIRFGTIWEDLIKNLDLASERLTKVGYDFFVNFTISRENFNEIGEFITFFRKYFKDPSRQFQFGFMNSLAPSNSYFLENNILQEHTHLNSYCDQIANSIPYILVDGRVSVCCRDYDGSLVVGNLNEKNVDKVMSDNKFKELMEAHENHKSNKIKNYHLCNSCFVIDKRVVEIWENTLRHIFYFNKNEDSNFYQNVANDTLDFLNNIKKSNQPKEEYKSLIAKYT